MPANGRKSFDSWPNHVLLGQIGDRGPAQPALAAPLLTVPHFARTGAGPNDKSGTLENPMGELRGFWWRFDANKVGRRMS